MDFNNTGSNLQQESNPSKKVGLILSLIGFILVLITVIVPYFDGSTRNYFYPGLVGLILIIVSLFLNTKVALTLFIFAIISIIIANIVPSKVRCEHFNSIKHYPNEGYYTKCSNYYPYLLNK